MNPKAETVVTLLLLGVCFGLTGWQLLPRLNVQHVPVTFERPDVTVSVAGAVAVPGVYALPWGSRVEDAVAEAFAIAVDQVLLAAALTPTRR